MGTALTERQLKELSRLTRTALALLRRRRGRRGGDAARDGARGRAGLRRARRHAAAGPRPGRRSPAGSRSGSPRAESYLVVPRAARDRARARPAGRRSCACARCSRGFEDSPERQDAVRLAADRLGLPRRRRRGSRRAGGGGRPATISPRLLETGDAARARRARRRASRIRGLVPLLAELAPEHFDFELHRRLREHLLEGGRADDASSSPLLARARRARRPRGTSTRRPAKELLLRLRERELRRELDDRRPRAHEGAPGAARADPRDGRESRLGAATIPRRSSAVPR